MKVKNNKNHFFIGYAGNKRNEFNPIYDEFKTLNNITTIYEPFCGTSAFSYFLSLKEPLKYKYILNDNNKHLINLYETARDEEKLNNLIDKLNSLLVDMNKEKYLSIVKADTLEGFIIGYKLYSIRPKLYPLDINFKTFNFNYLLKCPIMNFLRTENIIFTSESVGEIKDIYNNENTFIFGDPPYLTENNDYYSDKNCNIYEYLSNNDFNLLKCRIIFILSDNWIIKLLFKNYIKKTYEKKYEASKKKINHFLISNFNH